ncbi:MAG TPA: ImmA/IrrE family metallo-endopeptidase, partial [Pseudorhodoplanes sp.]|nr:ImmA/IrrE family metallo-endopeptidase [Pseudorhodoplanes sp.]
RIFLSSGVRDRALHGEPLSRFMIAHEMAHLLLHTDSLRSKSLSFDTGRFSKERIREEREASKFAAAFLMPIEVVRRIEDPQSLSHYCQVSLEAAQYRMTLIDQLRETSSPYRRIPQHLYKFLAQTFRLGKID